MTAAASTLSVLRDAVRVHLRRNAFLALREHTRAMPHAIFLCVLVPLVLYRISTWLVFLAAWRGWLVDQSYWADGGMGHAAYVTPFHGHPNPFGWRFGFQGFVAMHNITGMLLFAVCLVPLFASKGGKLHVRFGRAFVLLWLLHMLDGLANSSQILLVRGLEPTRYYDTLGTGFSLYLYIQFAFIASVVIDFLANGLAALQYKNRLPSKAMRAVMVILPLSSMLFGVSLLLWGLVQLVGGAPPATPKTTEFAVIYVVQVPAYLYLLGKNLAYWAEPTPRGWLHGWVTEHQRNMMFCVQVTLYTGLANATMRFAPWLTAWLFSAIEVGFIAWLLLKERAIRRHVVRSRLGLALVSMLRGLPSKHAAGGLEASDRRWVMKLFDVDGDSRLERADVRALLAQQGVEPTGPELDRIFQSLDHNDDGVVDGDELVSFLVTWFVPDPSSRAHLALAFRALDRDGNGHISAGELREALTSGADALRDSEVDDVLALVDSNGDGKLDWHEFLVVLSPGGA
jgi:Ca2+-binding EF-hand superfamily protein